MICPKPYAAAILNSLRKRFSCTMFYAHKATFQAYLFSFVLSSLFLLLLLLLSF